MLFVSVGDLTVSCMNFVTQLEIVFLVHFDLVFAQASGVQWKSASSLTCIVPPGQGVGLVVKLMTVGGYVGVAPTLFSFAGAGLPLDAPVLYGADRSVAVPTSITFRWLQSEPPSRLPPLSFTLCYWSVNDASITCSTNAPSQLQACHSVEAIMRTGLHSFRAFAVYYTCFFKFELERALDVGGVGVRDHL